MKKITLSTTIFVLFLTMGINSESKLSNTQKKQIDDIQEQIDKVNSEITELKNETANKPSTLLTLIVAIIGVSVASCASFGI